MGCAGTRNGVRTYEKWGAQLREMGWGIPHRSEMRIDIDS